MKRFRIYASECPWCDDEGFFTRDDEIDYIETPFEDFIVIYTGYEDVAVRCYIDGNQLELDCSFGDWEYTLKTTIDFRKIRKPSDLSKYLPVLKEQFKLFYEEDMIEGYAF